MHEYIDENSLGNKILKKRLELRLSQTKLGKLIGTTDTAIYNYEKDINYPPPHILKKLSSLFKVPIDYLDDSDYCKFIISDYRATIKNWRCKHNMSQRQASKITGISSSAIASWEKGQYIIDRNSFEKLRSFLND